MPGMSPLARRAAGQGWLKWAIVVTASFAAMLEVIDVSIVNVALPYMQGNLGATLSEIGWVSTSYSIANVIVIPLSAWLGLRFGKKRYFIFSLIAFTLASVLCGMATSLGQLILGRDYPGPRRRRSFGQGAGHDVRNLPARGAGQGEHDLHPRRHRRTGHRPGARRLSHRQFRLALDFLH